jgi:hypothetical protein
VLQGEQVVVACWAGWHWGAAGPSWGAAGPSWETVCEREVLRRARAAAAKLLCGVGGRGASGGGRASTGAGPAHRRVGRREGARARRRIGELGGAGGAAVGYCAGLARKAVEACDARASWR